MKKTKKLIAISILVIMMMLNMNFAVHAALDDSIKEEFVKYSMDENVVRKDYISPVFLLSIFLDDDVMEIPPLYARFFESYAEQNLSQSGIVKCSWKVNGDQRIKALDAQFALNFVIEDRTSNEDVIYGMRSDIAKKLGIEASDVKITTKVTIPQKIIEYFAEKYNDASLKTKKVFGNGTTNTVVLEDNATAAQIKEVSDALKQVMVRADDEEMLWSDAMFYESTAVATTKTQKITYKFEIGKDAEWYWVPVKTENLTPDDTNKEFKTELDYIAVSEGKEVEGKVENGTFLPPYYDNEDKDAHKDADAIAIITSKTKEEIVATNGVALTDKNTKDNPNSEGWYYPDVEDKTVIAKVYLFDDYDNTTDNGAVKETVKLTGKDGGQDSQTPSIRWTLRRINYQEKENPDGSVTVTITYNLPIDPDSIPEGWSPVYDADGKTVHKIRKTIKQGEDYDKDVTVKRNGPIDEKVTTPVKKIWDKKVSPVPHPQTGEKSVMAIVALVSIGVAGIAFVALKKRGE